MTTISDCTNITDSELLTAITRAAAHERTATVQLIALLAELDSRRLYLGEGCSSLFTYCTRILHLSEHAAYGRIEAARCARGFPLVLEMLAKGEITLTTITLLAPHLTSANFGRVLACARHKNRRQVEHIVATLRPLPSVPSSVRKLTPPHNKRSSVSARQELLRGRPDGPTTPISEPPADESALKPEREDRKGRPRPAVMIPLAPELYKIQITVSRETHDNLRRAQDLLRHVIPDGDPAAIVDRALTLLVGNLERTRLAATARPRSSRNASPSSRHVPASVRRQVWARDGGQCAFAGKQGRCTERGLLEIHHLVPFAAGGPTNVENLELRCRRHNQYEAEGFFGPLLVRETRCGYRATPFEPSWSAESRYRGSIERTRE